MTFQVASMKFHSFLNKFLKSQGFTPITYALWLDIRGAALSGRKVDAIKMLRDTSSSRFEYSYSAPEGYLRTDTEFFRAFVRQATRVEITRISLREACAIIDMVIMDEYALDGVGDAE